LGSTFHVFEKSRDLALLRCLEHRLRALQILGKHLQVARVRLAAQRTQPLLHPQVEQVLAQERHIGSSRHGFIIGSACGEWVRRRE
jgi:hypothetical protein